MRLLRTISCAWAAALVLAFATLTVAQQPVTSGPPAASPVFAGKYQGVAKSAEGDLQVTLQLVESGGKYSGNLASSQEKFEIVKGKVTEGVLSLELDAKGSPAKLSLRQREDKLVGELSRGGTTRTIELKRVDEFSGDWDGIANINDQNYPFSLSLKVEGDKVTGGSNSDIGSATITKGLLKDGKLVIELTGSSGAIILMDASMKDGNLIGTIDFNGVAQGSWVAVRRK
jgi:hypothetical protein